MVRSDIEDNVIEDNDINKDDDLPKDKYLTGVCLLKFKK
jgi:hypothetical protein